MIVLIILLVAIWFICVNAILNDAQAAYEDSKRKFKLFIKSDNLKFYPILKGNGECSNEDFYLYR